VCKVQHATGKGPVSQCLQNVIYIYIYGQYSPKYTDIHIYVCFYVFVHVNVCVLIMVSYFVFFCISLEVLSSFNSYLTNNCRCRKELSAFAIFWWFLHNQFYHHHWVSICWFSFIPCENAIASTGYCLLLSEILVALYSK